MSQTSTSTAPRSFGIDPQSFPRAYGAVTVLRGLPAPLRVALTDIVLADLRDYPLTERNLITGRLIPSHGHADGMWHRVRSVPVDERHNVEDVLRLMDGGMGPTRSLFDLVALFIQLREKRAELVEQLRALDIVEAAFVGSETAESVPR